MGRKGSWFSTVKKALSSESKERNYQKTSRPKKKWFGKQKLQTSASQSETDKAPPLPPPEAILPHCEIETSHDGVKVETAVVVTEEPVPAVQTKPVDVQATTIVQLHSQPTEEVAAIRIQKAFRGYLARRALRALRGLVRLRSLMEGPVVKRQAISTLRSMQTFAHLQTQIRYRRLRMLEENQALQKQLLQKHAKELESMRLGEEWDDSVQSKEQVEAKLLSKYEAAMRRERAMAYSFSHQRHSECPMDSKVINREVLQRELKEVLAKQAELGIEVAEIPSHYLKNSENRGLQNEGKNKFSDKRKFQNKFNKKLDRKGRFGKRQKFADNFSESPLLKKRKPTLLQKLLSADISKDKSHLFQVFRFMVINSFFKHCPDKPLRYPSVMVKENGSEVDTEKDVSKRGNEGAVKKIVSLNNDDDHNSEDEDSDVDENDSIVHNHPHEELFSLVKEEGFEKSDEEEGEILE